MNTAPLHETDLPYAASTDLPDAGEYTRIRVPTDSEASRVLTELLGVITNPHASLGTSEVAAAAIEALHHLVLADPATAEFASVQMLKHLGLPTGGR